MYNEIAFATAFVFLVYTAKQCFVMWMDAKGVARFEDPRIDQMQHTLDDMEITVNKLKTKTNAILLKEGFQAIK